MKGKVFVSYGMGGGSMEWWQNGLRQLIQRLNNSGYNTVASPYNWNDVNIIVAQINQVDSAIPIAIVGASLGANEAPDIASRTQRRIRYLGGFQTSTWGYRIGVPANVEHADNIYNPGLLGWLRTFGMGSGKWYPQEGNVRTFIRNIPVYDAHPDDWGIAQDIIFSRIQGLMP